MDPNQRERHQTDANHAMAKRTKLIMTPFQSRSNLCHHFKTLSPLSHILMLIHKQGLHAIDCICIVVSKATRSSLLFSAFNSRVNSTLTSPALQSLHPWITTGTSVSQYTQYTLTHLVKYSSTACICVERNKTEKYMGLFNRLEHHYRLNE